MRTKDPAMMTVLDEDVNMQGLDSDRGGVGWASRTFSHVNLHRSIIYGWTGRE